MDIPSDIEIVITYDMVEWLNGLVRDPTGSYTLHPTNIEIADNTLVLHVDVDPT